MHHASNGRLQGKVAIIVGAGQLAGDTIGNGRAVAERFAQEGAALLLVDIDEAAAEVTRQAVAGYGQPASVLRADIKHRHAHGHRAARAGARCVA